MSSSITNNQSTVYSAGSINECGVIDDLKRRGFTIFNCLCEIIANSIDAKGKEIVFIIAPDYIKIVDRGKGMNLDKLNDMFDMFKSNHLNDKSMGISGLGGKASTLILSKDRNVVINTYDGEKYLTANVPWKDIIEQNQYSGMININFMNETDIVNFNSYRNGNETGTSIVLPYDVEVHDEIIKNLTKERKNLRISERFDVIFGKFSSVEISLIDKINPTNDNILQHYDYFSKPDYDYYKGKQLSLIHVLLDQNSNYKYKFILEKNDEYFEIKSLGNKRFATKLSQINFPELENIGTITFKNAMMKNPKLFDELHPEHLCKNTLGTDLGIYDTEYFNTISRFDVVKEDLSKCSIVRNNQVINYISFDRFKHSSARADIESLLKIVYLRTELSYETFSNRDNHLDQIMGIQSNKNQLNPKDIPINLIRMLEIIKNECWWNISKHFNEIIYTNREATEAAEAIRIAAEAAEAIRIAAEAAEAIRIAAEADEAIRIAAAAEEEDGEDQEVHVVDGEHEEVHEDQEVQVVDGEDQEVDGEHEEVQVDGEHEEVQVDGEHQEVDGEHQEVDGEHQEVDGEHQENSIETITKLELIDHIKLKFEGAKDRLVASLNDCQIDTYAKSILEKFTEDLENLNMLLLNKID
jgi:hypothetical protein